jgi:hypothetical protein
MRAAVVDPGHTLTWQSEDGLWVWAFALYPDPAGTRLVSRNRIAAPDATIVRRAADLLVMEPGSLVMERRMLLGIKQRAERLAREAAPAPSPPVGQRCVPAGHQSAPSRTRGSVL